jgi:hypothetical protein
LIASFPISIKIIKLFKINRVISLSLSHHAEFSDKNNTALKDSTPADLVPSLEKEECEMAELHA